MDAAIEEDDVCVCVCTHNHLPKMYLMNSFSLQITELLNMLGLTHCWETPTQGLSGGQKKRLSVALELISNPPIIFLDEPTT